LEVKSYEAFDKFQPFYSLVRKSYPNEFEVLSFTFEPQEYGLAIREGKKELEEINRSLLAYTQESNWDKLFYHCWGKMG
jgi:hypothetical protein